MRRSLILSAIGFSTIVCVSIVAAALLFIEKESPRPPVATKPRPPKYEHTTAIEIGGEVGIGTVRIAPAKHPRDMFAKIAGTGNWFDVIVYLEKKQRDARQELLHGGTNHLLAQDRNVKNGFVAFTVPANEAVMLDVLLVVGAPIDRERVAAMIIREMRKLPAAEPRDFVEVTIKEF